MRRPFPPLACAAALLLLTTAGCDSRDDDGPVTVSIIGEPGAASDSGARLAPAAALIRAATFDGLVGFDAEGRVVPGIAERWIVTDDGQSYIFRLRDGKWPDGTTITGENTAQALRAALARVRGTPLGLDLAPIDEIRAMAGRVVELRLSSPVPELLTLLAQPELGLERRGRGIGPMRLERQGEVTALELLPPEARGLPAIEDWDSRSLRVRVEPAEAARRRFDEGYADLVLGGRIDSLPFAGISGLSRGNVRLDPVIGLFGLRVEHDDGLLAEAANREAISMAIDREGLIGVFNVGGWDPTTRLVAPDVDDDLGTIGERWADLTLEQRQAVAASRIASWTGGGRDVAPLRIAMPDGPGSRLVFTRLAGDLATIGLEVRRVAENAPADLRLVDQVARYGRATWFLNQLSCAARRAVCSPEGDALVAQAMSTADPAARAALLAEAEAEITAANGFIPLARPLRWSLVRGDVAGFAPNPWGWHPLPPLATAPR